jgi:hypothetical protein
MNEKKKNTIPGDQHLARRSQESPETFTEEFLDRRRQAMAKCTAWEGVDDLEPRIAVQHRKGIELSTRLSRQFKRT